MTLAEKLRKEGFENGMQQGMQKGIHQGMQKGMRQGMQQGIQQGIHQGKIEGIHQGKIEGLKEGLKQGLIEGVELAISLKFPEESIKIIPLVCQIPDIASLKAVKSVIVLSRTADELIAHIKGLF